MSTCMFKSNQMLYVFTHFKHKICYKHYDNMRIEIIVDMLNSWNHKVCSLCTVFRLILYSDLYSMYIVFSCINFKYLTLELQSITYLNKIKKWNEMLFNNKMNFIYVCVCVCMHVYNHYHIKGIVYLRMKILSSLLFISCLNFF